MIASITNPNAVLRNISSSSRASSSFAGGCPRRVFTRTRMAVPHATVNAPYASHAKKMWM